MISLAGTRDIFQDYLPRNILGFLVSGLSLAYLESANCNLNNVHKQTGHQVQDNLLSPVAAAPRYFRRKQRHWDSPPWCPARQPPQAWWLSMGTEFTIAIATAWCKWRRLDVATKVGLSWRRNSTISLHTQHLLVVLRLALWQKRLQVLAIIHIYHDGPVSRWMNLLVAGLEIVLKRHGPLYSLLEQRYLRGIVRCTQ